MKAMTSTRKFINDMKTTAQLKLMQLRKQEATPMQLALMTAPADDEVLAPFRNEHITRHVVPVFDDSDAGLEKFILEEFLFPHQFAHLWSRPQKTQKDLDYLRWCVKVMKVWEARKAAEGINVVATIRDTSEEQLELDQLKLEMWQSLHQHKCTFIRNVLTFHPLRHA